MGNKEQPVAYFNLLPKIESLFLQMLVQQTLGVTWCPGLNRVPPKLMSTRNFRMWPYLEIDLCRNWIFVEIRYFCIHVGPYPMHGVLIRRENRHTDTSKTTCEDTGRDSGNVVTAERPQDWWLLTETRRDWNRVSFWSSKEGDPWRGSPLILYF